MYSVFMMMWSCDYHVTSTGSRDKEGSKTRRQTDSFCLRQAAGQTETTEDKVRGIECYHHCYWTSNDCKPHLHNVLYMYLPFFDLSLVCFDIVFGML